jgi:hypothetical protein
MHDYDWIKRLSDIQASGQYALVHMPHLLFLPWVLAVCDYLEKHLGWKSVIFTADHHELVLRAPKFSPAVVDVIGREQAARMIDEVVNRPTALVLHAFQENQLNERLADALPEVRLIFYTDGPTNFHDNHKQNYYWQREKLLLTFGYEQPQPCGQGHGIREDFRPLGRIPWRSVFRYYRQIFAEQKWTQPEQTPPKCTVLLFMHDEYENWSRLTDGEVFLTIWRLLNNRLRSDDVVIVKRDYRFSKVIQKGLVEQLKAAGVTAYSYEQYLAAWGRSPETAELPFEMMVQPEMLSELREALVLDSSRSLTLPYLLHFLGLQHSFDLVVGARMNAFPFGLVNDLTKAIALFSSYYSHILKAVEPTLDLLPEQENVGFTVRIKLDQVTFSGLDEEVLHRDVIKPATEGDPRFAALYLPDAHWMPYVWSVAESLRARGYVPLLVMEQMSRDQIKRPSDCYAVLTGGQLDRAVRFGKMPLTLFALHSFGWQQPQMEIRGLSKDAEVVIYGDGFKNEIARTVHFGDVKEYFCFGYQLHQWATPCTVITPETVFANARKYWPEPKGAPKSQIKADLLICLRYYGIYPYAFDIAEVADRVWETVSIFLTPKARVVIKEDRRFPALTRAVLEYIQKRHKGEVIDLRELIGESAAIPVEQLLELGVLENIERYAVFDSSLSYILMHHPKVNKNALVILGLDMSIPDDTTSARSGDSISHDRQIAKEMGLAKRSSESAINTIVGYSEAYAKACADDGCWVHKVKPGLFYISRSSETAFASWINKFAKQQKEIEEKCGYENEASIAIGLGDSLT